MKKIFFVLPTIGFGGAEKVYIDLANHLAKKEEYEVTLVYISKMKNQRTLPKKLSVVCLNKPNIKSSLFALKKLFNDTKPEVVFSSLGHLNVMLSLIKLVFRCDFKLILRQTNIYSMTSFGKLDLIMKKSINFFYKKADKVIFQSEFMSADFLDSIELNNSVVINNPIDIGGIISKSGTIIGQPVDYIDIIFIGKLNATKNFKHIIDCFYKTNTKYEAKIHVLGDGKERGILEEYIKNIGLEKSVEFYGNVENPYKILKKMDFLINASKSEGFPNVLLESLSLDIPIFVKKHPGGTEELMDKVGLLDYFVDDLDFDSMIEELGNYPLGLSQKAKENFGIDKISKEYINLIEG